MNNSIENTSLTEEDTNRLLASDNDDEEYLNIGIGDETFEDDEIDKANDEINDKRNNDDYGSNEGEIEIRKDIYPDKPTSSNHNISKNGNFLHNKVHSRPRNRPNFSQYRDQIDDPPPRIEPFTLAHVQPTNELNPFCFSFVPVKINQGNTVLQNEPKLSLLDKFR